MGEPPTLTLEEIQQTIPETYKFIELAGEGGFGQVVKCQRKDTNEVVAVKLPYFQQRTQKEVHLLRKMMAQRLDEQNIVKFLDTFNTSLGKALVFEMLDMSLGQYLYTSPLVTLGDIRLIVQQMAVALVGLRTMEIIHTDIKLDNIMLCDHSTHPFKIKLIDFGSAIPREKVRQGMTVQIECYRAPEVILGLPFAEAIDVWSLGNTIASMLLDVDIFPDQTEFETLKVMIKLFGQPPNDVLDQGMKTHLYFHLVGTSWTLITDNEFIKHYKRDIQPYYAEKFSSLDELVKAHVDENGAELEEFIDLLKQMLQMNEADRITPAQILKHPFICSAPSCSGQSGVKRASDTRVKTSIVQSKTSALDASSSGSEVVMKNIRRPLEDIQECVSVQCEMEENLDPVQDHTSPSMFNVEIPAQDEDNQDCISVQAGFEDTPQIIANVEPVQDETTTTPTVFMEIPDSHVKISVLDRDNQDCVSVQSRLENAPLTTNKASPVLNDTSASDASCSEKEVIMENTAPPCENNQESVRMQSEPLRAQELNIRDTLSVAVSTSGDAAKKKNYFQRFFSWMRKHVSCFSANDVD